MIRHVHTLLGLLAVDTWWPLLCAWEAPVRGRKGSFPHLRKFVEDVRNFGLVGVIVHEYDDAFAGQDHRAEGRP